MTAQNPTPDQLATAERLADECLKAYPHCYPDAQPWAREQAIYHALRTLSEEGNPLDEREDLAAEGLGEWIQESWANSDANLDDEEHRDEDFHNEHFDADVEDDDDDDDDDNDEDASDDDDDDGDECPLCGFEVWSNGECSNCHMDIGN